jgi:hypothetical protein
VLDTRPGCALFLGARVDWVWTSQVLGFDPVFIHFRQENPLVALLQRLLPRATVVVGSHALLPTRDLPGVAFVDGHAGSFEFLFKKQDVIISTKGRRGKLPEGWHMHKARTTHAAVGGVTNSVDHCFLFSRGAGTPSQNEVTVPRALPRDVHSVISDTMLIWSLAVLLGQRCLRFYRDYTTGEVSFLLIIHVASLLSGVSLHQRNGAAVDLPQASSLLLSMCHTR